MVVQDIFILAMVKISLINAHLDLTAVFHHSIDSLPEKSRVVIYVGFLWGAVAQWPEHLQLKQEVLDSIPGGCHGFFFLFQLAY